MKIMKLIGHENLWLAGKLLKTRNKIPQIFSFRSTTSSTNGICGPVCLFTMAFSLCFVPNLYASGGSFVGVSSVANVVLGLAVLYLAFLGIKQRLKIKSLLRVKKVIESIPLQCGVCDATGNLYFYKDIGETETDHNPRTIKDLYIELYQELDSVLPSVFESQSPKSLEFDSFSKRYKINISLLPDGSYGVPTALWTVHDISDLANAYAERLKIFNLLLSTLGSIGDAVISTNCDGEISLINPSALHMVGLSESEILGKSFNDYFQIAGEEGESLIAQVVRTRRSYPLHTSVKIRNRDTLFIDGLITPIFTDNLITGVVLYFHDTTDLVQQGQKLQLALNFAQISDRAKSDFLATVSHEFRSSVNIIMGYCDLIAIGGQSDQRTCFESIRREAEKLLLMFNDILDVSKDDESTELKPVPVNFKEFTREIQRIFSKTSKSKKISLAVQQETSVPVILSDYKALRQIIMQLLTQAYSLAIGDSILLTIKWVQRNLVMEIIVDTRNVRIKQDKNLSIFKRLCERLNGTLNLSQTPNHLSFEIVLNKPEIVHDTKTSLLPVLAMQKDKPKKDVILLVDDIAINLKVLASLLKKYNIESVPCTTAHAAMEEINKYTPKAIFMDLWMPDISGDELANVLQSNPETACIPRILITADTQLDKRFEDLFMYIMYKPLNPKELQKALTLMEETGTRE